MPNRICATKKSTTRYASIPLAKVPVIAFVGAKEKENGTVTVRRLGSEKQGNG